MRAECDILATDPRVNAALDNMGRSVRSVLLDACLEPDYISWVLQDGNALATMRLSKVCNPPVRKVLCIYQRL